MITYAEYQLALNILHIDELFETHWDDLPQWAKEVSGMACEVIRVYERQQAELAAEDGEHDFPF